MDLIEANNTHKGNEMKIRVSIERFGKETIESAVNVPIEDNIFADISDLLTMPRIIVVRKLALALSDHLIEQIIVEGNETK